MDVRRSINTRVWSDDWFESINPSEKLLWIYLLTNAQTNMLGIYEISIKRIQFETGLNKEIIEKALKGFESVKKAIYNNGFIILPNWMKNQAMNTNMVKSAETLFLNLPNHLIDCLISNGFESFESLSKGLVILPKIEKEIEREIEKEIKIENGKDFEIFWKAYPKKKNKDKAFEYWQKKKGKPPIAEILAKLAVQIKSDDWTKDGGKWIPYPGSYINAGGWFDEIEVISNHPKFTY
jgi:hypothetical protein